MLGGHISLESTCWAAKRVKSWRCHLAVSMHRVKSETQEGANVGGQVTQEELQTAMGFMKEQLGEDELRALLDRLNDWQQDGATPIDVAKLMQMASSAEPLAPSVKP